jgi:DNA adenine methylase
MRPLVKWVGGKRKLAPKIIDHMPYTFATYHEPFVGGGALFCALQGRFKRAVLMDMNVDLIKLYKEVQASPTLLIQELKDYKARYASANTEQAEALYYSERSAWNNNQRTSARFMFLKATSFNGLWRVNSKGEMNAPWGRLGHRKPGEHDQDPCIFEEQTILEWHRALDKADLFCQDALLMTTPEQGDVVYLDPPYVDTFSSYTSDGFTEAQQRKLLSLAGEWSTLGATVLLSNSVMAKPIIEQEWPSAQIELLDTFYAINSDGDGRADQQELLAVTSKIDPKQTVLFRCVSSSSQ